MGTAIVLVILLIALIPAVKSTAAHMKGRGDCCGGGDAPEKKVKKQKLAGVVAEKHIQIEGMTCDHCKRRVENCLNSLDQVNATVSLGKKEAVVKLGADVPDDVLKKAIEDEGYQVISIA